MTRCFRLIALALVCLLPAPLSDAEAETRGKFKKIDVPFVGTPHEVVAMMLKLANVGPDDIVYDIGSGDGRIVIAAVRDFGAKAGVGVDIDPQRVREGAENAAKAGVSDRTTFIHADAFKHDFSEATALIMFMSTRFTTELLPRMRQLLRPGTRVVTYRFPILGWKPDKVIHHAGDDIFLWIMTEEEKRKP